MTGGKSALQQQTAKSGRVLGAKDRNGGKNGQQGASSRCLSPGGAFVERGRARARAGVGGLASECSMSCSRLHETDGSPLLADPSTLLFPAKPGASTSQAQPGPSCAPRPVQQQFKTPLPNKTLRPAQELRTPATALRPRHAPALMLGSPDVSMDVDVEQDQHEPQEEEDREVEYAGPSARDYGASPSLLTRTRLLHLRSRPDPTCPRRRALHSRLPRSRLQDGRLRCGRADDAAQRLGGPGGLGSSGRARAQLAPGRARRGRHRVLRCVSPARFLVVKARELTPVP